MLPSMLAILKGSSIIQPTLWRSKQNFLQFRGGGEAKLVRVACVCCDRTKCPLLMAFLSLLLLSFRSTYFSPKHSKKYKSWNVKDTFQCDLILVYKIPHSRGVATLNLDSLETMNTIENLWTKSWYKTVKREFMLSVLD